MKHICSVNSKVINIQNKQRKITNFTLCQIYIKQNVVQYTTKEKNLYSFLKYGSF